MSKKASPAGRRSPTSASPRTGNRQSKGASKPTGKAPRPLATPGGDPRQSKWGNHLQ